MNKYFSSATLLALFFTLPFLASCEKKIEYPLRIASSPWPGYEPLYLAREIGYLPPAQANIYELPSADITLESFRNGSADIATLTLDETLELLQNGIKLRVLLVMDVSNGADAVMAKPQVKTPADLKGRRIAVLNIPLGVYMLSRLLEAAKLERGDVQVIHSAETRHEDMYRKGEADAFITFDPVKSQLANLGAHIIFDSSRIPNEIFDLMVVREDVYLTRRSEVCNVGRQWYRTLEYMQQEPDTSAAVIAKRLGVSAAEYLVMKNGIKTPTLQENLQLVSGDTPGIVPPAGKLNEVMIREGQLKRFIDVTAALDSQLASCLAV